MKYIGLLIIVLFFVSLLFSFIRDILIGIGKIFDEKYDSIDKKRNALIRGVIGIVIEILLIIYFSVLLIYYAFH